MLLILIITLILLIYIYILFLAMKGQNYDYRLGDMFIHDDKSRWGRSHKTRGKNYHAEAYPYSIATEYMNKTSREKDYKVLLDIVNRRGSPIKIKKNTLIVHLRIGDVLENKRESVDMFLKKTINTRLTYGYYSADNNNNEIQGNSRNYVKNLEYYRKVLEKSRKFNIKKILLIGGFHTYKKKYTKSLEYVSKVKAFFESNGIKCETRINKNADEDFLIMCHSKYFTPSGGGFSDIIKNIVIKKNGIII